MNPAEIVVCEPQANRCPTEAVRQAGEAADLHSHREVLALHVRRANPMFFRVSHDWDLLRTDNFGGAVPALAILGLTVNLDVLRIIATVA